MNSYYSNLIEGQGTTPHNIERALHKDFSRKPDVARLQRIAVAHIEAEEELEEKIQAGAEPLLSSFAIDAHRALYGRLRVADRTTKDGMVVEPGRLRSQNVDVGIHVAPTWESILLRVPIIDSPGYILLSAATVARPDFRRIAHFIP